jgi:hypothetical protein
MASEWILQLGTLAEGVWSKVNLLMIGTAGGLL